MTPNTRPGAGMVVILLAMGAGWGVTVPLTKIVVTAGYQHFGLIFWQVMIGSALMGGFCLATGRRIPFTRPALRVYLAIALVGTIMPNTASYQAVEHLPSGVVSILLSLVPMLGYPMAIALGLEGFSTRRFFGLSLGLVGVSLLILPESSLPDRSLLWWIPVALVAPFFYAFEGNYIARWGTAGLDSIQVLAGASMLGVVLSLPLAVGSGHFINPIRAFGAPEWAFVASSLAHVMVYTTYVWCIGRAGPVFTEQVGYLVTGFGVVWAMLLLGEAYAPAIWAAMGLMLVGVALVRPQKTDGLAEPT